MSLFTASLNSGSNGNCYYIGNSTDAVLIDAGLSCRETEKRMRSLGLSMNRIRAIFISHEHIDHIKGVEVLSAKYKIPVYITPLTLQHGRLRLDTSLVHTFQHAEPVLVNDLTITPFIKLHDAADPHSFIISNNEVTIGVFTDLGNVCDNLVYYFSMCHAAYLETNYDTGMLENGRYPWHLKNRIRGGRGHLSNNQALELFKTHRPACMSHLLLSHLSRDNNSPELAMQLFRQHANGVNIIWASRYEHSALYQVHPANIKTAYVIESQSLKQVSLF